MKFYFVLQFRRIKRIISENGINVYLGLFLGIFIFFSSSEYIFYKITAAEKIYSLIGISIMFRLGEKERNDRLILLFKKKTYYQIRFSDLFVP